MVRLTRHFAAPQPISVTSEWLYRLSIDAANLLRLLAEDRVQFSPTQPDFTPKLATKLRIQRCQLLDEHLRHLRNDFKLISMALKVIIVESKHDRPDLATVLVRNQMTFACGMTRVPSHRRLHQPKPRISYRTQLRIRDSERVLRCLHQRPEQGSQQRSRSQCWRTDHGIDDLKRRLQMQHSRIAIRVPYTVSLLQTRRQSEQLPTQHCRR